MIEPVESRAGLLLRTFPPMNCASSCTHLTFSLSFSSQPRKSYSFKNQKQAFLSLNPRSQHPHNSKHHLSKSHSFPISFLISTSKKLTPILNSIPQNQTPEQNKTHVLKSHIRKVAVFLLASFLFFARFSTRPFLALPPQNASSSASAEEKAETQIGKDEEEDEELCMKILEKNPRDVKALKVVLYGKMKKGRTKEAVKFVEKLIEVEPDEVEWRLLQALSYELMGQLSKAKRLFKEILEDMPLQLRALHGLALVMHKNHEGPAVFEMLNKALELARAEKRVPEERNIRILIAQMHVVKGDLEEGLKKYQDLVNEDPRDFRPYLCQGIIYSLLDKKKEADEQFEIYQSLVPHEFPQRGFLDDVIMAAKTESQEKSGKGF